MSNSLRDMFVGIQFEDGASKTIDRIDDKMNDLERGLIKFGTKVEKSERGLKDMGDTGKKATNQLTDGLKRSEKEAEDLNREVKNSDDALGGIKRAAMGLAGIIAGAFAVDRIKDFAASGIELAAATQALNSQFEQVYTGLETTATESLNRIAKQTGVLPDRLKGSFVQMAAFAKTTGADTASALKISERATLAAADSAAFYDRSIEEVTANLQSFLKGNFENDAALGISATETTRNAKANALYGKSFKKLGEDQKQLTLLAMVEDGNKAAGAIGQAARESDGFENVIGNLKGAWDGLKGTMMTPFLDTVTGGIQDLTSHIQSVDAEQLGLKLKRGFEGTMDVVVPTFNAVKDGISYIQENKEPLIAGLSGIVAGFVALKVISTVSGMMTLYQGSAFAATVATHGLNAALRANPIGLVVTAIGLLVAGGVALYRNWDTVKLKAGELWATTKEKFAGIKSSVSDFVQPAIVWFDNLSTKWSNFKNSLTSFKMPGWVSSVGGAISGAASKLSGLVNGSHATGLANVPFDGYRAELHKGESVLTADQSNMLRGLGVLGSNGNGKPTINPGASSVPVAVATPNNGNGSGFNINVPIELIIQGNADDSSIQKLMAMLPAEVKRVIEEIFREKLATIGG